jgi:hypothetical protein
MLRVPGLLRRLFGRFRAGRWYPAEWQDATERELVLRDGARTLVVARADVELRIARDDEWQVVSAARLSDERAGQSVEYPVRAAECPYGHRRMIPTRFAGQAVALECGECGRTYTLREG